MIQRASVTDWKVPVFTFQVRAMACLKPHNNSVLKQGSFISLTSWEYILGDH